LESALVSVLVNGSPTTEFKPTRRLRQCDPLALFLFIVVAEGLARIVRKAVRCNMLKGVKLGRLEVESCVLQFAYDTLFFCEANYHSVFTIKVILRCYELTSGLKINFNNFMLATINVERNTCHCCAKTLNCAQMSLSSIWAWL